MKRYLLTLGLGLLLGGILLLGVLVARAFGSATVSPHFGVLLLRTDTPAAAPFYEALGFAPVASPYATHRRVLGGAAG
ncbi:MAG TPA: hypothetical protein VGV85_09445 [Longimicrobiaceae bacterium]|nr:hypothetical protein [Longimicrobiaceae bacterium]